MVSGDISGVTRLGLIGLGAWGKNYLTTVAKLQNCQITHICAKSKSTLSKFSGNFIKTTNYKNLLNSEIDGVIIATPASTHFKIARDFIKHQIPILVEKPLTMKLTDALILQKLTQKHKTQLLVGHEYLYNPAYIKLKEAMSRIGKINFIHADAGNWGPFRHDTSTLWDWGPHDIAMLIDLLENMPYSVAAWEQSRDLLIAKLNFKNTTAFIKLSRRLMKKIRQLTIVGEKKTLIYDEFLEKKLALFDIKISYINYSKSSPLEEEIKAFIKTIKTHQRPKTDIDHGLKVIQILDALQKSSDKNGKIIALR